MEPMKGHESSDDDRPVRPGFKAPIPVDLRSGESTKPNRPSLAEQLSGSAKESAPERPKVVEEGLLFERPSAEDKLKPAAETPQPPVENDPTQPVVDTVGETEPNQQDFDQEVERQIAAEVATDHTNAVPAENNPAAEAAQHDMLNSIREEVAGAHDDTSAESIIDQSFEQAVDGQAASKNVQETVTPVAESTPAPDVDPLVAARQATESAYADQPPAAQAPVFETPAAQPQPTFEGAVPVPPAQVQATQPKRTMTYGSRSSWFDRLRGRQEGKQAASNEYRSQLRSKDSLINKFKKLINQRQHQINEQVPAQQVQAETAPLPNRREPMTMPLPPEVAIAAQANQQVTPPVTPEQPMPANLSPFGAERQVNPNQAPAPVYQEQLSPVEVINRPPTTSEQIPAAELVKIAERIYVDGVTVRSMFEVGRFDEDSLRRIVDGYLHGRNMGQLVNEEVQRHDRERFNRFETLNQVPRAGAAAQYGPIQPTGPQQIVHGSLPQPVMPATMMPNQANGVNPNQPQPTAANANSSAAERIVLGVSIFFIVVAAVILIGLFTRG